MPRADVWALSIDGEWTKLLDDDAPGAPGPRNAATLTPFGDGAELLLHRWLASVCEHVSRLARAVCRTLVRPASTSRPSKNDLRARCARASPEARTGCRGARRTTCARGARAESRRPASAARRRRARAPSRGRRRARKKGAATASRLASVRWPRSTTAAAEATRSLPLYASASAATSRSTASSEYCLRLSVALEGSERHPRQRRPRERLQQQRARACPRAGPSIGAAARGPPISRPWPRARMQRTAIAPPIDEPSKKTGPGWALGVAAAVAARMPSTINASAARCSRGAPDSRRDPADPSRTRDTRAQSRSSATSRTDGKRARRAALRVVRETRAASLEQVFDEGAHGGPRLVTWSASGGSDARGMLR